MSARARRAPAAGDRLFVVGVTGGVASGKSTFVECLAAGGPSRVVDADREGHAVVADAAIARSLADAFGADVLDARGRVERGVLGPRVFASAEALARLNAIVQPPLLLRLERRLHALASEPFEGMVILDAALLVEWDAGRWCDRVIAVLAPPEQQIERLMRDRAWGEAQAKDVVARQRPNGERTAYADVVLENDGARASFEQAARAASEALWAEARASLARRGAPRST